jgi:autotransporter-associated beta strand protein
VTNNDTLIFNRAEDLTYGGAISGSGVVMKEAAGKLVLTGAHTYTGLTTVKAGTLVANGSIAGPISVQAAGTLGGSGSVGGLATIDGRLAPGSSIGTLHMNGNCIWNGSTSSSPTMLFELSDSGSDRLEITGAFTKGTGTTYQFNFLGTGAGIPNGTVIALATFGSTNFTAANFSYTNLAPGYGGTFSIVGGTQLNFQITAPTPLESWRLAHFGTTADSGAAANFANPDADEYFNLVEFARDGNPHSGGNDGKMVAKLASVSGTSYFTLTLPIRIGATFSGTGEKVSAAVDGIIYRIQGSTDLVEFTTRPVIEVIPALSAAMPALNSGWEYRTFRLDAGTPGFLRVGVNVAP